MPAIRHHLVISASLFKLMGLGQALPQEQLGIGLNYSSRLSHAQIILVPLFPAPDTRIISSYLSIHQI